MATSKDDTEAGAPPARQPARPFLQRVEAVRREFHARLAPAGGGPRRPAARTLVAVATALFLIALGARILYLQDHEHAVEFSHEYLADQPRHYQGAARRILAEGTDAFFTDVYNPRGGARLLVHPPGYPLFIAAAFAAVGDSAETLRLLQLVLDSVAVVLLFLIVIEILPLGAAATAALLAAASPQFASSALVLQPDTTAVLPALGAMLALAHAWRKQSLALVAVAGLLIGASCWVRSNSLLLPLFLAATLLPALFPSGSRLRAAVTLVLAAYLAVAPITVRNWVAFGRFVPISLGGGTTLIEGIGDFDPERRFGFPSTDKEVAAAEAEWHGRPEYARGLWAPDGIERDRDRFRRGLSVIIRNPVWFATVMARRSLYMVRYNDDDVLGWPADSSLAPPVSREQPFGHDPSGLPDGAPLWTGPIEAAGSGRLESPSIPVEPYTDYLVRVPIIPLGGAGHLRVVDERDTTLASAPVVFRERRGGRAKREGRKGRPPLTEIVLPFASNDAASVRIRLIPSEGTSALATEVGTGQMWSLGSTPHRWLRVRRTALNLFQSGVYRTDLLRGFILAGFAILVSSGRRRAALFLVAVPAYYVLFQSALHTEYRYILVIHHFLFAAVAVTVYCVGALLLHMRNAPKN